MEPQDDGYSLWHGENTPARYRIAMQFKQGGGPVPYPFFYSLSLSLLSLLSLSLSLHLSFPRSFPLAFPFFFPLSYENSYENSYEISFAVNNKAGLLLTGFGVKTLCERIQFTQKNITQLVFGVKNENSHKRSNNKIG